MIIKADTILVNLAGKNLKAEDDKDLTFGMAIANMLLGSKSGGKMKLYILGKKLFEGGNVEVDLSDLNIIKEVVRTTENYNALVSGQCEVLLEEVKE